MTHVDDSPAPRLRRDLPATPRQREALEAINTLTNEHGMPPTLEEIGSFLGISKISARDLVLALEARGLVRRDRSPRSIEIAARCFAPVVEVVGAGVPATAQCLVCEEFVHPPHLLIGEWETITVGVRYQERVIETRCPHCDRRSVHIQRR